MTLQTREQMLEGYLREIRRRDRRSSPDRDETRSGSVGEANRAPVPNGQSPNTPILGDSA